MLAVFSASSAFGSTITVTNTADSGTGSLRDAIVGASAGDTIDFNLTYPATITLTSGDLFISPNLTINGPGASKLAISGNNLYRVFDIGSGATVTISGLTIQDGNVAGAFSDTGGGIRNTGALTVSDCALSNNTADFGGGIYNFPGKTLTVTNCTLSGNSAALGGGIYNDNTGASAAVSNSTLSSNSAGLGAGIYNVSGGSVAVSKSTLSSNSATTVSLGSSTYCGDGGGIVNGSGATLTVTSSTLSSNSATSSCAGIPSAAGGIDNGGTLIVTDSTLSGNSADFAGGIANGGTLSVTTSTLSGNFTNFLEGGGIENFKNGAVTVTNSTLSGNFGNDGGGIENDGTLTVTSSTFSGNRAGNFINTGGGISNEKDGTVTLKNTILAGSSSSSSSGNCYSPVGTITSQDHNISDDTTCDTFLLGSHDLPNTPAGLDTSGLKDNGGPTKTIALQPTSPAVNAINPLSDCSVSTDQRGVSRPQGTYCDIGAFELPPNFSLSPISPITASVGGSGSSTVTVNSIVEFSSAVTLTLSGAPNGVSTSFNTNSVTPPSDASASSTLTVNVGPSVIPGSFTLTVTGTSGSLTHSTPANVTVGATTGGTSTVIGVVQALGCIDNSGISMALISKLAAAQADIDAGKIQPAINTLSALLHELQAQAGKHIKTTCTDSNGNQFNPVAVLIADVQALLASLQALLPHGAARLANPILGNVVNFSNAGLPGAIVSILSGKKVVATAATDAAGFYYLADTSVLTVGSSYTARVAVFPKGYKTSTPASQTFKWGGTAITLGNSVLM